MAVGSETIDTVERGIGNGITWAYQVCVINAKQSRLRLTQLQALNYARSEIPKTYNIKMDKQAIQM